jgi:adenylate cyclase
MTQPKKPSAPSSQDPRASLEDLAAHAAAKAHDRWVKERLAEGWRPSPSGDAARREHPFLVPFARLPAP